MQVQTTDKDIFSLLHAEQPISGLFDTELIGGTLRLFDTVDSTNLRLKLDAMNGLVSEGAVYIAEHQAEGRGRFDRQWVAPPGTSLLVSVLLTPRLAVDRFPLISLMTSLALRTAVTSTLAALNVPLPVLKLKWPNDLLAGSGNPLKIAGILCEGGIDSNGNRFIVIGTGINVNQTADDFGEEVAEKAGSLRTLTGCVIPRSLLLQNFLLSLESHYFRVVREGDEWIAPLWFETASINGMKITVSDRGMSLTGTVAGIEPNGALRLVTGEGKVRIVYSGDVL